MINPCVQVYKFVRSSPLALKLLWLNFTMLERLYSFGNKHVETEHHREMTKHHFSMLPTFPSAKSDVDSAAAF